MKIHICSDSEKKLGLLDVYISDEDNYSLSHELVLESFNKSFLGYAQAYDMVVIDIENYSIAEMELFLDYTIYNSHLEELVMLFVIDSLDDLPVKSVNTLTIIDYVFRPINWLDFLNKVNLHMQYKKQIRKNTYLKSRALEATANAIAITDLSGIIQWVNPAFSKLTGYTKDESIGASTSVLKSDKQNPKGYKHLWDTVSAGKVWRGELINRRKCGKEYHEEMTITPLYDEYGIHTHYIAIKQDITDRKEREQQLLLDANLAKQVQKGAISKPINTGKININGLHISSERLSGDMCAWYELPGNRYGIILYDVMGHGISAALITMSIRSLLRGIITKFQDPQKVIKELNYHTYNMFQDNDLLAGFYFTAIYILIDVENNRIEYVNAGHPPAILVGDGHYARLEDGCIPCGVLMAPPINNGVISYKGKTNICIYTDGMLEAIKTDNPNDNENKSNIIENKIHIVEKTLLKCKGMSSKDIIKTFDGIISLEHQKDDICLVAISILGNTLEQK
ncbi:SpoIIE family protein phosphatase [Desulfuribacillus alkaliarsenatis]|uniref:PAS domain-containing protein n=1 Tax=Desulfuribacillus alkaliarsenatis TaxID=766136 RepID=A0A1E5G773_9FIRM|nr:PP2C family protein-serine/threonine phosphatase [Desulfuribacillus alkaliarsenatis]OEF98594.1 hypothetical protein BHF68_02720 [Desulfuribacillus alkaliarsenatis]